MAQIIDPMQFIITTDSQQRWHWHLYKNSVRSTPRAIAKSAEGFNSRSKALRAVAEIRKTISDLSTIEVVAADIPKTASPRTTVSPRTTARSKVAGKNTYERIAATRVCAPKISRRTRKIKVGK